MKSIFGFILVIIFTFAGTAPAVELSEEYQQDLVDRINYLKGQGPKPLSLDGLDRPIHGTSTAFEAFLNFPRLNSTYKSSIGTISGRHPNLPYSYVSPGKHFRIHYDIDGTYAVYKPQLDTLHGGDGNPDYVNKVAEIADSVWDFEVNHLGYPSPPRDDFYPAGLDSLYDIYIINLGNYYYGATYPDSVVSSQSMTSVIELDNDYDFYPYNQYDGYSVDFNRRLDAVRVTMAHEFFHSIHFTMDWTEWEIDHEQIPRLYWWEMSAVWMEEMMYDDINDYRNYLGTFYDYPWVGLRDFSQIYPGSLHPYGACVFPIFLTEKWGDTTIVRKIWENCRDMGVGPQFKEAVDAAVYEISGGTDRLVNIMQEFTVWNLFTGGRSNQAPAGIGYSERAFFPAIPDAVFIVHSTYPIWVTEQDLQQQHGDYIPYDLGSNYIAMDSPYQVLDDFTFIFGGQPDVTWGISFVGFPKSGSGPATVIMPEYSDSLSQEFPIDGYEDFSRLFAIPVPVDTITNQKNYDSTFGYAYAVFDSDTPPDDTAYSIGNPDPNPAFISTRDQIEFVPKAVYSYIRTSGDTLTIEKTPSDNVFNDFIVHVFNKTGAIIWADSMSNSGYDDTIQWDLKEPNGDYVSPGIYFANCQITFDNDPEIKNNFTLIVTNEATDDLSFFTDDSGSNENNPDRQLPEKYILAQNHPNPFNSSTVIRFALLFDSHVSLVVYNLLGQKIATIVDEIKPAGNYTVCWDGTDNNGYLVTSGIYFYQIKTGDIVKTRKMLLLK